MPNDGDVSRLTKKKKKRNNWESGRVTGVKFSSEGLVRFVSVLMSSPHNKKRTYKRSIHDLVLVVSSKG